jgi:phosphoribosylglycinamide formyltransferase 1
MSLIQPLKNPPDGPLKIGALISGGGTTVLNLLDKIESGELSAEVNLVIASRNNCSGIEKLNAKGINVDVVPRNDFSDVKNFSESIFTKLRESKVDLVVLAGFLSLIEIPKDFYYRVINIHPGLIPSFCGKGFYGGNVHQAAIDRGVKVSGCTVHFADNIYDHGPIIVQKTVPVLDTDSADILAERVFEVECEALPEAIQLFGSGKLYVDGSIVRIS